MNVQHKKWLGEILDQISEVNRPEVKEYLETLIPRCHSRSRTTFCTWARLQLSKNEDHHDYLKHISELRLPLEVITPHQREGFKYTVNGNVVLIDVGDETAHIVWRVPLSRLAWALSMFPVRLRRLPDLEPPEIAMIRTLKRQLRMRSPFLTPKQKQALKTSITELEAIELRSRAYRPIPRYMIVKYVDGQEHLMHRLFLEAGPHDEVTATDGDFTNMTTAWFTKTVAPVVEDGLTVVKGEQPPSVWSDLVSVQNLQIIHSDVSQKNFEASMFQAKLTPQGDIDERPLRVQPNANLAKRAMCHGKIVDAGAFDPLSQADAVPIGYVGRKRVGR